MFWQLQVAKFRDTKPTNTPTDELDLRKGKFHKIYGKKYKTRRKKKGVKQKTDIFPDMSDVPRSVCVF